MDNETVDLGAHTLWEGVDQNIQDRSLNVRFRHVPKKDEVQSKEAGRPIFKSVEYVSISSPGDKFNGPDRPATDYDRRRFSRQYAAFRANKTEQHVGTLLSKWPLIEAAQVEELKFFNVHTVEHLASMPDGNIPNVGNISHLKKQAADFLEMAKGNAPMVRLREEHETTKAELEILKRQAAEQSTLISKLLAKQQSEELEAVAPKKKTRKDIQDAG
jgi:hypothetical protein